MSTEFKKIISKNETYYVLEDASAGATSAGAVASVAAPLGSIRRRIKKLREKVEKVSVPKAKPRNPAGMGSNPGRGTQVHKDKKRDQKVGKEKHKKPFYENILDEINTIADIDTLNELSTEKLAQYKKAAGKDASAADKAGNYEKGNKRFRGIVKATKKQFSNDLKSSKGMAEGVMNEDEYDRYEDGQMNQEDAVSAMFTRLAKQGRDPIDMIANRFGWGTHELDALAQQNGFKNTADWFDSFEQGVAEGFPHDVDHMPGKTVKHQSTNCIACHGRKSMYKLGGKLFADNKQGAVKVKCPTCKGTGEKQGVAEEQINELSKDTLKSYHKKAVGQLTKGDVRTDKFDKREAGAMKAYKKAYDVKDYSKQDVEEGLRDPKDNPCWKGYKPVGTKKKSGKTVPNCVPVKEDEYIGQLTNKLNKITK